MKKRIHVVTPVTTEGLRRPEDFLPFESEEITVTCDILDAGPASIECEFDEAMAVPGILKNCIRAEKSGADAIVIDCLGDPGVKPAREVLSIPVFGPGESSMHMAAMLGMNFSVVTVLESVRPMITNMAKIYAVKDKLASIRVVEIPVLDLEKDMGRLYNSLADEAVEAVRVDGAHGIILGCTGMLGCAETLTKALRDATGAYVPVVDPVPAALVQAIAVLKLGLSNSKLTYGNPPDKPLKGYDLGQG